MPSEVSLDGWLRARSDADRAVPGFVERAFRRYVRCGVPAFGVAHYRCTRCTHSRVVALSCKGRVVCPRCVGRTMTSRALDLVTRVLPPARLRQWVLSLPFALRPRVAFDHDLALAISAAANDCIAAHYRRVTGLPAGLTGAVTVTQRFGSDLGLNPHFHTLFLDGAYPREGSDAFFHAPPVRAADVERVLDELVPRIERLLDDHDAPGDDEPLGPIYASATAPAAFRYVEEAPEPHDVPAAAPRAKARLRGFDLDATVHVAGHNQASREQLCRYLLRPAVAEDRLRRLPGGRVELRLKRAWSDGTTHVVLTDHQFLDRLAAAMPRPRKNQIVYYGALSPRSKHRKAIVPTPHESKGDDHLERDAPRPRPGRNHGWAELMRHSFGLDVLHCPKCRSRMRFVAVVTKRTELARLLPSLGLRSAAEPIRPARAPPDDDSWAA